MHAGKMFITDLDGTLFRSDHTFSETDINTLEHLGEKGIIRVIATGRSLFSFRRSVRQELPIDYLIFSTGSGIARYPDPENNILIKQGLTSEETTEAAELLDALDLDFMIQKPLPENHRFQYRFHGNGNNDFRTRLSFYKNYCEPLGKNPETFGEASQLLAIVPPEKGLPLLPEIRSALPGLTVIKTTSPFDGETLWIEIFPKAVSKSRAALWLAEKLNVRKSMIIAVGNDYNDEDLLQLSAHSFVVENAPEELKQMHTVVPSNDMSGVSEAAKHAFRI